MPTQAPAIEATAQQPPLTSPAIISLAGAAREAIPAVVSIVTTEPVDASPGQRPDGQSGMSALEPPDSADPSGRSSLGSGVIVSTDGYVLTNHHVVEAAGPLEVILSDGSPLAARLIGSDPETDLALLATGRNDLRPIAFSDPDAAQVGDLVLAIGNPFGVGQTVTMGIVSALGRDQLGINTFENFIQTDAAINPGNSGGALVDAKGRLLGINTAIFSRNGGSLGIGFAIPISTMKEVFEQLRDHGSVVRGFIGVEPQDIMVRLDRQVGKPHDTGTMIAGIVHGGPAARAGVNVGDIVVAINDQAVTSTTGMLNTVARLRPGTTALFDFLRDGQALRIAITVDKRPADLPP